MFRNSRIRPRHANRNVRNRRDVPRDLCAHVERLESRTLLTSYHVSGTLDYHYDTTRNVTPKITTWSGTVDLTNKGVGGYNTFGLGQPSASVNITRLIPFPEPKAQLPKTTDFSFSTGFVFPDRSSFSGSSVGKIELLPDESLGMRAGDLVTVTLNCGVELNDPNGAISYSVDLPFLQFAGLFTSGEQEPSDPGLTKTFLARIGDVFEYKVNCSGTAGSINDTINHTYNFSAGLGFTIKTATDLEMKPLKLIDGLEGPNSRLQIDYEVKGNSLPKDSDLSLNSGQGTLKLIPISHELGSHRETIPISGLGSPPASGEWVVSVLLDVDDVIAETSDFSRFDPRYGNNIATIVIPETKLTVTAQFDDQGSSTDSQFGLYLAGVPLQNQFTAKIDGSQAKSVTYQIDGGTERSASATLAPSWIFNVDVGALAAGNHTLKVLAYDSSGAALAAFQGSILITDQIDLELQVSYFGGFGSIPIEQLRLIEGSSDPTLNFHGTIDGIPLFYSQMVRLAVEGGELGGTLVSSGTKPRQLIVEADQYSPKFLAAGTRSVSVAFHSGSVTVRPGFDQENFRVITLPPWMGIPKSQGYRKDAPPFGSGAYVFELSLSKAFSISLPDIEIPSEFLKKFSKFNLFQGAKSSLGFALNFTVYAKPTLEEGGTILKLEDGGAHLTLLDQELFNQKLPTRMIDASVNLKPDTLEVADTITVTSKKINLTSLFQKPFFNETFGTGGSKKSWAVPLPGLPLNLSGDFAFDGTFRGELTDLEFAASIGLTGLTSGKIQFDTKSSYIDVTAKASATLDLVLEGSVGVGIGFAAIPQLSLSIPIVKVLADGRLVADLSTKVHLGFAESGLVFDQQKSSADLNVSATLGYRVRNIFDWIKGTADSQLPEHKLDPLIVDIPLFGTASKLHPSLEGQEGLNFSGPGNPQSQGYSGVIPSEGQSMVVLGGPASEGEGLGLFSAEPVRASVQLLTPVSSTLQVIDVDLNVLADLPMPTPGTHFLDVVLVGLEGEIQLMRIDLADFAQASNANPLGFASGWKTLSVAIPSGVLKPGMPYRIEFRYRSNRADSGETLAVALDRLVIEEETPAIVLEGPQGGLGDGRLDFGTDTVERDLGMLHLDAGGSLPLFVTDVTIVGTGYVLVDPPTFPLTVLPDVGLDLQIRRLNPSSSADARLIISSDDPNRTTLEIVLAAPPVIAGSIVNGGAAQRSNIEQMAVVFSEDVNIPALIKSGEIVNVAEIYRLSGTPMKLSLDPGRYHWDGVSHSLLIDLSIDGFGGSHRSLLEDGRYELRLHKGSVRDSVGAMLLDPDHADDSSSHFLFHRLLGDVNGDAAVNSLDLVAVRNAMLGILDLGGESWGDVNGDGKVDIDDYTAVKKSIGKRI